MWWLCKIDTFGKLTIHTKTANDIYLWSSSSSLSHGIQRDWIHIFIKRNVLGICSSIIARNYKLLNCQLTVGWINCSLTQRNTVIIKNYSLHTSMDGFQKYIDCIQKVHAVWIHSSESKEMGKTNQVLLEIRIMAYPWERRLGTGMGQKDTCEMLLVFCFFLWILVTWKVQFRTVLPSRIQIWTT